MTYYWWGLLALSVWIFIGAIKLAHLERNEKLLRPGMLEHFEREAQLPAWLLRDPRNGFRRNWLVRLAIVLLWPWLR
jgi:hypothetical protein